MKEEKNILSFLLFLYGLAFAFLHIMPTLLPGFLKRPLTWGDALDFLSVMLFSYWGISHSGFPQFSELGWI